MGGRGVWSLPFVNLVGLLPRSTVVPVSQYSEKHFLPPYRALPPLNGIDSSCRRPKYMRGLCARFPHLFAEMVPRGFFFSEALLSSRHKMCVRLPVLAPDVLPLALFFDRRVSKGRIVKATVVLAAVSFFVKLRLFLGLPPSSPLLFMWEGAS